MKSPNVRKDGYDQARLLEAEAKRLGRRMRNIRLALKGGIKVVRRAA